MAEAEEEGGPPDHQKKSPDFPSGSGSDEEFELLLWQLRTPRTLGSRRKAGGRLRDVLDSDQEPSPSASYRTRRPRGVTGATPARPEPPVTPAQRSCGALSDGEEGSSEGPAPEDGEEAAERPGGEAGLPLPASAGPDPDSSEDEFESLVHLIPRPARGPARTPRTPSIRAPARLEPPAAPARRSCGALSDGEEGSSESPAPGDGEEAAERPGGEAGPPLPASTGPDSSEDEFESLVHLIPRPARDPARTPRTPSIRGARTPRTPSIRGPGKEASTPPSGVRKASPSSSPRDRRDAEDSTPLPNFKWARGCSVPDCFLPQISAAPWAHGRKFQEEKKRLVRRLYQLYNTSVFDSKLPEDMEISWNKKLRMTAGFCATGQKDGRRHARIELSEKVCDSAERLRDTVIHEMCHAATWLVFGIRAAHGPTWKAFARKAAALHPELPRVTRCHSYQINYKFTYECARCGHRIGRHSKSLDPQRHVCGRCLGPLALLPQAGKGDGGTPRPLTPFARFVKSHYASTRRELAGQSHGEIMRQLGADFASKVRLQEP
ncbi:acidic repeat-containing protein isoform X1 [Tachyglossus aculeatus]|uniref:acidic repeat-containing protein isoform X1 n=1 Tax=Tachyglossus aculeatus TaxID=9261 RepID=UPI0018F6969E|nr:acidic repeat-containing protein isoform X1 [Tachyglossus aculeatus]